MTHRTLMLLALISTGCGRYDLDPRHTMASRDLWDPLSAIATDDGLYVRLPSAGDLALLAPGQEPVAIQVDDATIDSMQAGAGGAVLVRSTELLCDEGLATGDEVADCPDERLTRRGRADWVGPTGSRGHVAVGPWYGRFAFSDDGAFAVATVDPTVATTGGGLVNLTSVLVMQHDVTGSAETTVAYELSVGFAADRVLFFNDATGKAIGMLVLSQSEVALVDLTGGVAVPTATFPLTLDASQTVTPIDVALTPDNAHALITIEGSGDLYVLDLVNPSINIVSLAGNPSAMRVDPVSDRTYIVYKSTSRIDVLDHVQFDVETLAVASPSDHLVQGPGYVLAYSLAGGKDAFRVDTATLAVDTYRLTLPATRLEVSPEGDAAVALTADTATSRLEVLDLRQTDGKVDNDVKPFGLDGPGVGIAFTADADGARALVLQQGVDTLYSLSWPALQVQAVDLASPPVAIGAMPDGDFFITHGDALGLVSFLDAAGTVVTVSGFGRLGMLDRPLLTQEEK